MENDILNLKFFDAQIFLRPEHKNKEKDQSSSNQAEVLVVYTKSSSAKEHLELLSKILSAVNFDLQQDVQSVVLEKEENASFSGFRTNETLKNALIFGVSAGQLGLHFDYQLYAPIVCNGCRFLFADDLAAISADKSLKGKLWQCLQNMFLTQ